ncbi:MAG: DUF427 domain-containing protein [Salinimicrobium sp.]
MKAIWNNTVLAESDQTQLHEEKHYFPPDAINSEYFQQSDSHNVSPSIGKASYFHIKVGEDKKEDAAWFYPHPNQEAADIKNFVTFSDDIKIEK